MSVYAALGEMIALANKHFIIALRGIYPPLLIQDDLHLKTLAWEFIEREKPLRERLDAYQREWLEGSDLEFTPKFLQETFELFDELEARIEQEKNIFLPRLQARGVFAQTG
jgi:hypothetical protein